MYLDTPTVYFLICEWGTVIRVVHPGRWGHTGGALDLSLSQSNLTLVSSYILFLLLSQILGNLSSFFFLTQGGNNI